MGNRYHRRYLLKKGATSQISEWNIRNTKHNLLIHSLGVLSRHRNNRAVWDLLGSQTLPQLTETPEHQWNSPKNSHSDKTQACWYTQKPLWLFAQAFLKHPAWGRRSEQATQGQPVKNSAATSNWQRFYNRKRPAASSTARPSFSKFVYNSSSEEKQRNIAAPISGLEPTPLTCTGTPAHRQALQVLHGGTVTTHTHLENNCVILAE